LATKMLASTVQFSSYGRSRSAVLACPALRGGSRADRSAESRTAPAVTSDDVSSSAGSIPQDPTARLGRSPARLPVPEPKLCTREKRDVVAAYWSVFHP